MMQSGVVFVESTLYQRDFPDAKIEVLPGVAWGLIEAFPSPLTGLIKYGQTTRNLSRSTTSWEPRWQRRSGHAYWAATEFQRTSDWQHSPT